mgnify:CR=1 FL=1
MVVDISVLMLNHIFQNKWEVHQAIREYKWYSNNLI